MVVDKSHLQGTPTRIFKEPQSPYNTPVTRQAKESSDNVLRFRAHQEGPEKDEVIATEFEIKKVKHLGEFSASLLTELDEDNDIQEDIKNELDAIIEAGRADLRLRHNNLEEKLKELQGDVPRQIPLNDSDRDIEYEQIWRQITDRRNELTFLQSAQENMSDDALLGSFHWLDKKVKILETTLNSLDAQRQKRAAEISQ